MDNEVNKVQYESLIKKIDSMQKTMDLRFQEWSDDRKDISNINVRLKTVEAKVDAAREDVDVGNQKVMNKVDEHLQAVPDVVSDAVSDAVGKVKKKKWFQLFRKEV